MSRTLKFSEAVPSGLCNFGAIIDLEVDPSDERKDWPEISIPCQYQLAMDPLFEDEPWHDGKIAKTWGGVDDEGLAKLNGWPPAEAANMLKRAIARLPADARATTNFWDANPGNVKIMLKNILRITEYAEEHYLDGVWHFSNY